MDKVKSKYKVVINSSDDYETEEDLSREETKDESIENEIKTFENIFNDEGFGGLRKALSENSNKWRTIGLHIAVTGSSGSGKSAFINAIRDVSAEDEHGAEVGVNETTKILTSYKHPKNPNFIVWDMPGVGTPHFPKRNYIEFVNFNRYDFFMILSKDRFTEDDSWLAREIQKRGKRFYFVRTNIDVAIHSNSRSNPNSHSPHRVIENVRKNCQKYLKEEGFDKPYVFLVDNHDRNMYEFGQLELQLVQDCDSLKMEAMALSLFILTKETLQKKKKVLEERIIDKAMEIACLRDDYEQQRSIFEAEMTLYREQFSLDKKVLSVNKDILSLSDENLKEFQDYFIKMSATTERSLQTKISDLFGDAGFLIRMIIRLFRKWRWIKGDYSHSLLQFSTVALLQNLDEVHKTALKVYNLEVQKGVVESAMSF